MLRSCRKLLGITTVAVFITATPAVEALAAFSYTNEASFTANLAPGYYLEDFHVYDGLPLGGAFEGASVNFGPVSGYSYTATAPTNGLYGIQQGTGNGALSTNNPSESLKLTFTGNPVTAIGGIFFPTDSAGRPANGTVTVTLSNGSTSTIVNNASAFRGFTSAGPIASLQIFTSGSTVWPSVDHLYVGAAVPEPASILVWSLLALAIGGVAWWRQAGGLSHAKTES